MFFFKQKTAYEMRISDWSSDVCSSDLHWHPDHHVGAGTAIFLAAHAVFATLGTELPLMAKVNQGIQILVGLDPDTAAIATLTAVRPTTRDSLFAPKAGAAVAAVARQARQSVGAGTSVSVRVDRGGG